MALFFLAFFVGCFPCDGDSTRMMVTAIIHQRKHCISDKVLGDARVKFMFESSSPFCCENRMLQMVLTIVRLLLMMICSRAHPCALLLLFLHNCCFTLKSLHIISFFFHQVLPVVEGIAIVLL